MQFAVMPDHLFGASVRINGQWIGVVEREPLTFSISGTGESSLLVELSPLASDPSGDVYPLPLARIIRVRDGEIVPPLVEADGFLHIRRAKDVHQLHFIYPKVEALDACYETLQIQLQTETADFDHDGRLDTLETFATNRCGHVRVRSATGAILLQEVFPDSQLHVDVADLNRDGRPDVLIFWQQPRERTDAVAGYHVQFWDPANDSLQAFDGFTGARRIGLGDVLLECKQQTPFLQVIRLFRYTSQAGHSSQVHFLPVRTEEKMLLRAESQEDAVEALLGALEIGSDVEGAKWYVTGNGSSSQMIKQTLGTFYAHEIVQVTDRICEVKLFQWTVPGYYDQERVMRLELVHMPDQTTAWKVARAVPVS